ncbi:MAG: LysE family transporter [Opitutaceae bacterium]|nr:LysE family transporter [Opitutaceae bacterium]
MLNLWKGLIIGFSIAAPVGPIGLLCIRRALAEGRWAGFASGLGAATADAVYGIVAALGLGALTTLLLEHQRWLQLGGGLFLVYLGVATFRAAPQPAAVGEKHPGNLASAYLSTLALTLANPMTILAFLGIFAGLGNADRTGSAALLVAGVFLGSALWWLLLSVTAGWMGERLRRGGLRWVNAASGAVIAGFGVWQLAGWLRSA